MIEKPEETSEKDWGKMNKTTCGLIRSYLTQDVKYHVLNVYNENVGDSREEISDEENRVSTASKEEALSLSDEERTFH